jgi:hypothetical protein
MREEFGLHSIGLAKRQVQGFCENDNEHELQKGLGISCSPQQQRHQMVMVIRKSLDFFSKHTMGTKVAYRRYH